MGRGIDSVSAFMSGIAGSGRLKYQISELQKQERSWRFYAEQVDELNREINYLRKLQQLPAVPGHERVSADIIQYDPSIHRMVLNVGSRAGIKQGQAVASAEGLIGVVQTCDADRSQVLLVTSPTLRIGAMIQQNPPVAGIIRGLTIDKMALGFLEQPALTILPGTLVTTSVFSDVIPPNIPIGEVVRQDAQPEYGIVEVQVRIYARFAAAREVVVYK